MPEFRISGKGHLGTLEQGEKMAEHATTEYAIADGNDYVEHERTYAIFTALTKWGAIAVAVVLVLMWIFLL